MVRGGRDRPWSWEGTQREKKGSRQRCWETSLAAKTNMKEPVDLDSYEDRASQRDAFFHCRSIAATFAEEGAERDLGPGSHLQRVRRDDVGFFG